MKLLVANRAEIAVRIMSTAAVAGIETVAVYAADDAACAHVTRADAAVLLPGEGPAAYLDMDAIVSAAVASGCDTLHPGYGFLAESGGLARRCDQAGIRFAGPRAEILDLFADKTAARARAASLGIPLARATQGAVGIGEARAFLASLGPGAAVMVKAVAGGGGLGIRPVTDPAGLADALRRSASEAAAAFGSPAVYVEELLPAARHIEVQVIGDGSAVAVLGDRDCSLQRRRQKLIEIAPAALGDELRKDLHEAARKLIGCTPYEGLATVEFLVTEGAGTEGAGTEGAGTEGAGTEGAGGAAGRWVFLEVNPRIQVEHTVTEEVTGLDLIELMLRVAAGATLADLGLPEGRPGGWPPEARGCAIQARVNAEALQPDGTVLPAAGTLGRFQPPAGRGVRVDTHGYPGYTISPRYDSLLAKVIATGPDRRSAASRLRAALGEFALDGVTANLGLLRALARHLDEPGLDTTWIERHPELIPATAPLARAVPATGPGRVPVIAPLPGTVVAVLSRPGDLVTPGTEIVVLEAMKMEHAVTARSAGIVSSVAVAVGETVPAGALLAVIDAADHDAADVAADDGPDLGLVRPDLAEVNQRHDVGLDEYRGEATARRHASGRRTARESIAALLDAGSFVEYGALAIAAQRRRRSLADLIERTPADGIVMGTGTVAGTAVAVMSYDYSVLAGTQGIQGHRKSDRLFELARRDRLPVVIFAEGGGGRPGDTDSAAVAHLDVPTFRLLAALNGHVPLVAVVSGYCFAGNAALAAACDVIIATEGSSLGMGGPAMIEGGGLGVTRPADVGPMAVQVSNGVVDVLVPDDVAAAATARQYLGYFGPAAASPAGREDPVDQRMLRHLVPENRVRAYDIRPIIGTLFDSGSVLELRSSFGIGVVIALARLGGRPVGVLASNPRHLGGAIDGDAADKATRFLELCQAHRIPVISLCDTPGFMVGPEAEKTATVRRFGAMFVAGARLTVPVCMVVLRKAYGLGAMAMAGGDLRAPLLCVAWPTGEFGGMGLEGAVRLGFRKELDAIADPGQRQRRYEELVAEHYEKGKALSAAAAFEIDDVIDPARTREILISALGRALL